MTLTHALNVPLDNLDGGRRTAPASPPSDKPQAPAGAGFLVSWWLIQGLALGAIGGGAVSGVVIGSVLGLRHLFGG